ncbi:MAG: nicotinic acid mononucleotide adenyltransferase [Eudoraea sp.]|nr:nicotinic acid mononucleotide adenyltransferase [Eudoraea sp.]
MNKLVLVLAVCLMTSIAFGQKEKEVKLNKETQLVEATYYHDNGAVSQEGTFSLEGKLHGEWVSFDEEGVKISEGSYVNGIKNGKWYFWNDGIRKEVEFKDNAIASVINKESASGITKN